MPLYARERPEAKQTVLSYLANRYFPCISCILSYLCGYFVFVVVYQVIFIKNCYTETWQKWGGGNEHIVKFQPN